MAKEVQVGGVRTSGGSSSPGAEPNPQPSKFKYEYQSHSDYPALWLSLQERVVHFMATGTTRDERPRTKMGTYTDMPRFSDCYLGTNDPEFAKLLESHPWFGLPSAGGKFWRKADMDKVLLTAKASAIRQELAKNPELRAALQQGENEDFELPSAV